MNQHSQQALQSQQAQNTSKKSRRLQKKLHIGEFAVLGFAFSCTPKADFNNVFDSLISLVDSRNLQIWAEGNGDTFEAYITSSQRYGSATDEDRKAIETWLNAQDSLSHVHTEKLTDAYYG